QERDAQRDERQIGDDEIDAFRQLEPLARVHALARDDAGVGTELPVQLALAHIDRVHPDGAALEEAVGEAAGGRPDVQRDLAARVDAELVQGRVELLATARHEPRALRDRDRRHIRHRRRGAVGDLAVHANRAREDERLRALAAGSERTLDEQLVEPDARRHHRRKPIPRLRAMPKRLPRSRTLKGDPKLAYYDSGGGTAGEPPIVLLHGATFRSEDWENIFPRLATRYRVIA